jgi:hypothetical protein
VIHSASCNLQCNSALALSYVLATSCSDDKLMVQAPRKGQLCTKKGACIGRCLPLLPGQSHSTKTCHLSTLSLHCTSASIITYIKEQLNTSSTVMLQYLQRPASFWVHNFVLTCCNSITSVLLLIKFVISWERVIFFHQN